MYILNLETSTKNCSVSLAYNGKNILTKEVSDHGYTHSEKLHIFIKELLQESGISFKQLDAIGLSKGPGSYTGLRIGASAAKGLCFALDIPLISLNSLTILAHRVKANDGQILPMLDARRMEVYTALYSSDKKNITPTQALIIDENSFSELTQKTYIIGDGAAKCSEILKRDHFIFLDGLDYPSSQEMAKLSLEKFLQKDFENTAYFEPFYLKEFFTGK